MFNHASFSWHSRLPNSFFFFLSIQVSASSTLQHDKRSQQQQQQPTTATPGSSRDQAKVSRTKSLKMKILGGSGDEAESSSSQSHQHEMVPMSAPIHGATMQCPPDWPTSAPSQPKSNIREKLRKFFLRRPTMDDLFRRGIIRNEPVFGSTLRELHQAETQQSGSSSTFFVEWVPAFVRRCVAEIERDVERLRTDGVYRQSGNLSHVQRIRLQVSSLF